MQRALMIMAVLAAPPAAAEVRPDLSGYWTNRSLTSLERPEDFKGLVATPAEAAAYERKRRGKPPEIPEDDVGGGDSEWWETDVGLARIRGQTRTSWLTAPANGQLPVSAAAKAFFKARRERMKVEYDNPESRGHGERCLTTEASGPPLMNGGYNDNYQFVQTGEDLAIYAEYMHDVRVVRMGAKAHLPRNVRVWLGDSIGRWEGATLVVETTNFTPAEVQAPDGDAAADMRVVERFTRLGPDELHYAFRVENPKVFVQSWEGEQVLRRLDAPIFEFACHEGNYSLPNILAGGRERDRNPPAVEAKP